MVVKIGMICFRDFTTHTVLLKHTVLNRNELFTHSCISLIYNYTHLGIPLFMWCHILQEESHDGTEHELSEYSVLIGFTQHHVCTPGQRVNPNILTENKGYIWTYPSFTNQMTTLGEVKGSPADNLQNLIFYIHVAEHTRPAKWSLTGKVPFQL